MIAGDGPARSELEQYAEERALPVTFVGNLSQVPLPAYCRTPALGNLSQVTSSPSLPPPDYCRTPALALALAPVLALAPALARALALVPGLALALALQPAPAPWRR